MERYFYNVGIFIGNLALSGSFDLGMKLYYVLLQI